MLHLLVQFKDHNILYNNLNKKYKSKVIYKVIRNNKWGNNKKLE